MESRVYIPIITDAFLKSPWANQELGYAYQLYEQGRIKVIPIVEKFDLVNQLGFINERWKINYVINITGINDVVNKLKQEIDGMTKYPIEIDFKYNAILEHAHERFSINVDIPITNTDCTPIEGRIGFLSPLTVFFTLKGGEIIWHEQNLPPDYRKFFMGTFITRVVELPKGGLKKDQQFSISFNIHWGKYPPPTSIIMGLFITLDNHERKWYELRISIESMPVKLQGNIFGPHNEEAVHEITIMAYGPPQFGITEKPKRPKARMV